MQLGVFDAACLASTMLSCSFQHSAGSGPWWTKLCPVVAHLRARQDAAGSTQALRADVCHRGAFANIERVIDEVRS